MASIGGRSGEASGQGGIFFSLGFEVERGLRKEAKPLLFSSVSLSDALLRLLELLLRLVFAFCPAATRATGSAEPRRAERARRKKSTSRERERARENGSERE